MPCHTNQVLGRGRRETGAGSRTAFLATGTAGAATGRAGGPAGHRRRDHRGGHRPRRGHAGTPHGAGGAAATSAAGTSSRSSRLIHGGLRYLEHGQLRLVFEANRERPDPAPDRAPPGPAPAVHLSAPPRRPGAPLAARRRHVALRSPGAVPQCAGAPHAGQARPARGRADAARARAPGGGARLLRRPVRRRPARPGHGAVRDPARRPGGELCRRSSAWSGPPAGSSGRRWRTGSRADGASSGPAS